MNNQAILAKTCVCLLLVVNVAAYYFFWPKQTSDAHLEAKSVRARQAEESAPNVPAPLVARPKEFAAPGPDDAAKKVAVTSDELVQKLLAHMKQEDHPSGPPEKPRPLLNLQAEPLVREPVNLDSSKVAVTSPLTARSLPIVWTFRREAAGQQTLLIAELQGAPRGFAEFRILCDRIDTTASKDVLAIGNVAFTGANLHGDCQRLTIPIRETKLILEGKVRLIQESAQGILTGERLIWDAPSAYPSVDKSQANPAILGAPK